MLSTPEYGWTTFSLGSEKYRLSYLTSVPSEWLFQAIHGLENLLPFTVHGFSEPGRVLCTVSYWNCHILFEDDGREKMQEGEATWHIAHVSMIDFCRILHEDISRDIDAWACWHDDYEMTENQRLQTRQDLETQLRRLKELIQEKAQHFIDTHFF